MKLSRRLIIISFVIFTLLSITLPAYAMVPEDSISTCSDQDINPRADVIIAKYRVYNGVYQYRRWNETRGYWVDPYWIDM